MRRQFTDILNREVVAAFVLAISGLDSRKETVGETYAAALANGIGFIAVDSPGTGQAPVKASETADKMYSRAGTWPDPIIFRKMILPREIRRLGEKP